MAKFESFGFDDDLIPNSIDADCPICGESIEIPLDRDSNIVICPHCNAEIEIESS